MARQRKQREAVTLTSPQGTKVTVSKESAGRYEARGYKAPAAKRAPAKKSDDAQ